MRRVRVTKDRLYTTERKSIGNCKRSDKTAETHGEKERLHREK
jgi:hypothetical protein